MSMLLEINRDWRGEQVEPTEVVQIRLAADARFLHIEVSAPFYGDPRPNADPGPTYRLWEHEVVEVFIAGAGEPVPYLEVELGPHGHHLVLELEGRRNTVRHSLPMAYANYIEGARWTGRAQVPRAWLPPGPHRLNAYAIHGVGLGRRYLALAPVPGEHPDFHRLHCFVPVRLPT